MVRVDHVQVAIPRDEEARARWFYGEMLGLKEIEKPESLRDRGGVWFESANLQVHLGVEEPFRPSTKAHVGFAVADLGDYRRRLSAAGLDVADDDSIPGVRRFFTADPFGNRVEILESVSQEN